MICHLPNGSSSRRIPLQPNTTLISDVAMKNLITQPPLRPSLGGLPSLMFIIITISIISPWAQQDRHPYMTKIELCQTSELFLELRYLSIPREKGTLLTDSTKPDQMLRTEIPRHPYSYLMKMFPMSPGSSDMTRTRNRNRCQLIHTIRQDISRS